MHHNALLIGLAAGVAKAVIWQPTAGTTWEIVLSGAVDIDVNSPSTTDNVQVLDFDLFTNTEDGTDKSKIDALHKIGKKVICYFSAGSYEPDRPDSTKFTASDKGSELVGWPGEYWLDLKSANVAAIMKNRIATAAKMGCDAIDPDNVDAYDNNGGGLGLTEQDSVNFVLNVLAPAAIANNLALGLKNAASIVTTVIDHVQFSVNEQCSDIKECASFTPFITAGKPVFHIEYPPDSGSDSPVANIDKWCFKDPNGTDITAFSTVIKTEDLDGWVEFCNGKIYKTPTSD
ncbi:hypothetical protein G7046_g9533 [Stylonectria norvegica]|nr:hypothetical protein G7046_g9533 [Stylonectria norvegica]